MNHESLPCWVATAYFKNMNLALMKALSQLEDVTALFQMSSHELRLMQLPDNLVQALKKPDWRSVEEDLKWGMGENHHIITWDDVRYPKLLREIADPPFVLFVKGNPDALSVAQVAVVGSRHATRQGLEDARGFSKTLAAAGVAITSGLALGIDGASHGGAMDAGGITIAVAGTGIDTIYPPQHRGLADQIIAKQGAMISEFPRGTKPLPWQFPRRNRIIAGLSQGVLVVEAALKSGSLITARLAAEYGRDVFAIPGSIHQPLSRGCHYLIRQGAKLVEMASDVLEEMVGVAGVGMAAHVAEFSKITDTSPPVSAEQKLLLDCIDAILTPVEVIISRCRLTSGEVSSMLLVLELNGLIQSVPGGYVRLI